MFIINYDEAALAVNAEITWPASETCAAIAPAACNHIPNLYGATTITIPIDIPH